MDRAEDFLSIQYVTEEHVYEVAGFLNRLSQVRYWKDKNSMFRTEVAALSELAKWLLTFTVWFELHNTRFSPIDASRYYNIEPASSNSRTFSEFIEVIGKYNRKRVLPKNEVHIVAFLQGCNKVMFDFYLALFEKKVTNVLPKTEVYDVLDVGIINLQEIYGSIEVLQTTFAELNYPVAITMLPDPDYKLVVHAREPRRTFSYYQNKGKLLITKDFITLDAEYIKTPRYTIIGYSDVKIIKNRKKQEARTVIYPLDYFGTYKEYRGYVRTKTDKFKYTPFKERIENLKHFLHSNYLRQYVKTPIGFATNAHELAQQILELYPKEGNTFVVITDNNTSRTGKAIAIPVADVAGMIHELWIEYGVPKGFTVWFNGALHNVSFDFSGANNALLNNPKVVCNKMLSFKYLRIGSVEVFISKEISWEQLQWKTNRHKSGAYLEKCVLCGGTDQPHKFDGLCRICELNVRKYFGIHGADNWIKPSRKMTLKRGRSGWSHTMLDVFKPSFQGHYIIGREDGSWCFKYDADRFEKYKAYLEKRKYLFVS